MEFELYNFDHKVTSPTKFTLGDFKIIITKEHCDNLDKMPANEKFIYTHDENGNSIIIKKSKTTGDWINTATVKIDNANICASKILSNDLNANNIVDLCNLLTFLTGRRVAIKENIDRHNSRQCLDHSVRIQNIIFWGNNCWNKLPEITNYNLGIQFVNLTYAYESNEFMSMAAYITSTLNAVYDEWWKNEQLIFLNKSMKRKIKKKIRDILKKSFVFQFKKKLISVLHSESVSHDIIEDVEKTINEFGKPSAIYKLKKFLIYLDVYPEIDNQESKNRLKWINTVRNLLVHNGSIPKIGNATIDKEMEVAVEVIFICLSILTIFFASKLLNIEDYYLDSIKKDVANYFITGKFRGRDVFSETYSEFMQKVEDMWVNEGILLGR